MLLAALLFFAFLLLHFTAEVTEGVMVTLRPIAGFALIDQFIDYARCVRRSMHVSLGTKGVGGVATAETLAGLAALEHVAGALADGGLSPLVTVADPTLLPLAEDATRRAVERAGHPETYNPGRVRLVAPDALAYAAGTADLLASEGAKANVMVGWFGREYLVLGQPSAERGIGQVAGTVNPETLAFMAVSADEMLLGEEIFAASAYLDGKPSGVGSLLAQDWMRFLIVLFILIGVLLKTVG
jgi:hypothetical protein